MKLKILLLFVTTLLLVSCKNQKMEYLYSDKEDLFDCSFEDIELIKEAVYTFEEFILKNYDFNNNNNLKNALVNYLNLEKADFIPMAERFDNHMIIVINRLKMIKGLWQKSDNNYTLNINSSLIKCITNNLQNLEFKNLFSILLSSNTLKTYTIAPAILRDKHNLLKDKAVITYIAMDMFYAKVINLNFSLSPQELSKYIQERNKKNVIQFYN